MSGTRLRQSVIRRPSLPLTARDEEALARIRSAEQWRLILSGLGASELESDSVSEAALLHAIFEVGLAAIEEAAADAGYAALAESQAKDDTRRAAARRRVPVWSHEA